MRRRLLTTVAIGVVYATTAGSALGDGGRGPGAVQGWDGIARALVVVDRAKFRVLSSVRHP